MRVLHIKKAKNKSNYIIYSLFFIAVGHLVCDSFDKTPQIILSNKEPFKNLIGLNESLSMKPVTLDSVIMDFEYELKNSSIKFCVPKYHWKTVGKDIDAWNSVDMSSPNVEFMVTKGTGVTHFGSFCINNSEIFPHIYCQNVIETTKTYRVVNVVPLVINVGVSARFTYAHIITDILPFILLVPKEVRRKAYIVDTISVSNRMTSWVYPIVGITSDRIIKCGNFDLVYAFECWTPKQFTCENHFIHVLYTFRQHILHKYPMTIEPTRYIIIQRGPNNFRHISNMDALVLKARSETGLDWEIQLSPEGIEETVKFYQSIKIMFLIGGSAFCNMNFMHEDVAVAELHSEISYIGAAVLACACNIRYCIARDPNIQHFSYTKQKVKVDHAMSLIKLAISRLDEK